MEKWKRVQLKNFIQLNYGKSLVASKRESGDIPVYSSSGITEWHSKPLVSTEGIIVGRKWNVVSVFYSDVPFYCIDMAYFIGPEIRGRLNPIRINFDKMYAFRLSCTILRFST